MLEQVGMLWGAASVIVGVGLVVYFNRQDQRVRRRLGRMATTPVAIAAEGAKVKIVGTIEYGLNVGKAPLSGRRCAFSSVIVETIGQYGASEVGREEHGVEFFVRDESGLVRVMASGHVESALAPWNGYVVEGVPRERYLKTHETACELTEKVSVRELILTAGTQVAVAGRARWELASDVGTGYRDNARTLVLYGSESAPILVSDDAIVCRSAGSAHEGGWQRLARRRSAGSVA